MSKFRQRIATGNPWAPLYIFLLLLGTTTPFHFRSTPHPFVHTPFPDDVLANIVLFLPFGIMLKRLRLPTIVAAALLLSTGIELLQQWMWRSPSTADIAANGLGAWIGARPPGALRAVWDRIRDHRRLLLRTIPFLPIVMILAGWQMAADRRSAALVNWIPMPVTLGNEHATDRPYEGYIDGIQIFDRVVQPHEIAFGSVPRARADGGPLFFIHIADRVVAGLDAGKTGPTLLPLDLPPRFSIDRGRLRCDGGRFELPDIVSTFLFREFLGKSALSVAALIDPDDAPGRRQSRVITMSAGAEERCFTLGLRDGRIVFRVRTPASGPNGRMPQILSGRPLPAGGPMTILCTYDEHWLRASVNGKRVESLMVSALVRPNAIGRGLPFFFALVCTASVIGAWLAVPRALSPTLRVLLMILAAALAYGIMKALAIDRHYPPIPLLLSGPSLLATLLALRAAFHLKTW